MTARPTDLADVFQTPRMQRVLILAAIGGTLLAIETPAVHLLSDRLADVHSWPASAALGEAASR